MEPHASTGADAEVVLTLFRDGEKRKVTVTLKELPEDVGKIGAIETKKGVLGGMTVAPLSSPLREKFDIPQEIDHGVVVTEVQEGDSAQNAGLAPGAVILEINRKRIDSVQTFTSIYNRANNQKETDEDLRAGAT